jgi:hypothetical protein
LAMTARCIDIDVDKYEALCKRVRQLWRRHIPWYPMCVSTHRVLRHSPNMLRRILVRFPTLRLSHLSEESGESLNKYLKSYQLEHAFQGISVKGICIPFESSLPGRILMFIVILIELQ